MQNLIDYNRKSELIEENYSGQHPEQMPIYLVINWADNVVYCETRCKNIDGCPMVEWLNIGMRFNLPDNVDASELHDYIEDNVMPQISKAAGCFDTYYNGNNQIGNFEGYESLYVGYCEWSNSYDVVYADIESLLDDVPVNDYGGLWSFDEYFELEKPDEVFTVEEAISFYNDCADADGIKIKNIVSEMEQYYKSLQDERI